MKKFIMFVSMIGGVSFALSVMLTWSMDYKFIYTGFSDNNGYGVTGLEFEKGEDFQKGSDINTMLSSKCVNKIYKFSDFGNDYRWWIEGIFVYINMTCAILYFRKENPTFRSLLAKKNVFSYFGIQIFGNLLGCLFGVSYMYGLENGIHVILKTKFLFVLLLEYGERLLYIGAFSGLLYLYMKEMLNRIRIEKKKEFIGEVALAIVLMVIVALVFRTNFFQIS